MEVDIGMRVARDQRDLRTLAWWHFGYAAAGFLLAIAALVVGLTATSHTGRAMDAHEHVGRGGCLGPWMVLTGLVAMFQVAIILVSGFLIRLKRLRLASCTVGLFCCFGFPIGTVFGVYTLSVLTRPSIKDLYARRVAA